MASVLVGHKNLQSFKLPQKRFSAYCDIFGTFSFPSTELVKLKQQMAHQAEIATKSDHNIRELQNREQDLMEALGAKDSQLAVLRVRLEEADREKESRQRAVEGLQSEKERYGLYHIYLKYFYNSGVHKLSFSFFSSSELKAPGELIG